MSGPWDWVETHGEAPLAIEQQVPSIWPVVSAEHRSSSVC